MSRLTELELLCQNVAAFTRIILQMWVKQKEAIFMIIRKVNGVVLFVQDLDRCMTFYRDTLGLEIVFSDPVSFAFRMENQDFLLLEFAAAAEMVGEAALGLHQGASHEVLLCADVEDVDAAYQTLTSKGVTFIRTPKDQHWGLRTAYFADPEGHLWELRQPIPAAQ
jgi:lactoylglutathione lyase